MPPSWPMANKSGILPLLALFSIAAFACLASEPKSAWFLWRFSAKRMTPPKSYLSIASATSALTLVRSLIPDWPPATYGSPAWSFGSLFVWGHVFNQFFHFRDAVDATVGEAGTAARSVVNGVSATSPIFCGALSGVGEATTSFYCCRRFIGLIRCLSCVCLLSERIIEQKPLLWAAMIIIFFIKRPPSFNRYCTIVLYSFVNGCKALVFLKKDKHFYLSFSSFIFFKTLLDHFLSLGKFPQQDRFATAVTVWSLFGAWWQWWLIIWCFHQCFQVKKLRVIPKLKSLRRDNDRPLHLLSNFFAVVMTVDIAAFFVCVF